MPRHATPLTSVRIRNARPDEFPLYDSQGLYLVHTSTGSKRWRLKYTRPDGRENRMALGALPDVSLAQARLARDQARALLRQAIDPVEQLRARKRDARRVTEANFPAAARAWLEKKKPGRAPETYRKARYIVCSMSRRGNCHDNAVAESFFQPLKRERAKRKIYLTRAEATSDVFDCIEMFYNSKRRHGSNDGLSPVEFERRHEE